jgi:hypothetical protein
MNSTFWSKDPTILFQENHIFELMPTAKMSLNQKLNSITRFIIFICIIGFIISRNYNLLVIGIISITLIYIFYKFRGNEVGENEVKKIEGFEASTTTNPVTLETLLKTDFHPIDKKNPFGNVLLTDIMDNPERKSAAPAFNPDVYDDITRAVKKQTQMLNSSIENTNKQLYGDLKDNYDLDNSMQRFYSTPNTRVENDANAYAQYLYGSMYSGKESTPEGAWMREKQNYQYINP